MKKNTCLLNGSKENECRREQENRELLETLPPTPLNTSVMREACRGSKDLNKRPAQATASGSPNIPVHKRNNVQLQLRKLGSAEGRWSVEENSLIADEESLTVNDDHAECDGMSSGHQPDKHVGFTPNFFVGAQVPVTAHQKSALSNGNSCSVPTQNGLECDRSHESQLPRNINHEPSSVLLKNLNRSVQMLNNNLTPERNSLSNGSDYSPCSSLLYKNVLSENEDDCSRVSSSKTKINNNVGESSKPSLVKDGMEEYFKECQPLPHLNSLSNGADEASGIPDLVNAEEESQDTGDSKPCLSTTTITTATIAGGTTREIRAYNDDHLNLLNGDDYEDEDECIYTYKEGSGFDDNLLRHLLTTCVSCGLPNYRPEGDRNPLSPMNPLNDATSSTDPQQEATEGEGQSLFSPDMDFLEMDFDPGSTAEDAENSDCDDNCYADVKRLSRRSLVPGSAGSARGPGAAGGAGGAVVVPSSRTGMDVSLEKCSAVLCRRCESDPTIVNKVVNRGGRGAAMPTSHLALNSLSVSSSNQFSGLDDRPNYSLANSGAVPKKIDNIKLFRESTSSLAEIEVKYNPSESSNVNDSVALSSPSLPSSGISCDSSNVLKQNIVSNTNLGVGAPVSGRLEMKQGVGGDLSALNQRMNIAVRMPQDEGALGSGRGPNHCDKQQSLSQSSQQSRSWKCSSSSEPVSQSKEIVIGSKEGKPTAGKQTSWGYTNNLHRNNMNKEAFTPAVSDNNLGSLSAPEVSPAHEYPHHQTFKRSISFHNQLSSPKYENVCSPRPAQQTGNPLKCPNSTPPVSSSTSWHNAQNKTVAKHLQHRHTCSEFSQTSSSQNNFVRPYQQPHAPPLLGDARPRDKKPYVLYGITISTLEIPESECCSSSTTAACCSSKERSTGFNCVPARKLDLGRNSASEGISSRGSCASENRLLNRHVPVYNISPMPLKVAGEGCQGGNTSINNGGDEGDGDKLSSLVVKGSLPPKTSDPSLDVNTTPSPVHGPDSSCPRVQEKVMVWTERQAVTRQVLQIHRSACGLSAVANVLLALEQHIPPSTLFRFVVPRRRAEDAPLVDYLLSRSCAGTTHEDLIEGMRKATRRSVVGKFFPMFPKRAVQLSRWLADWIKKGGVAVGTRNLQRGVLPGQPVPDAWHHQMIFGVGPQGVYLTNPVECVSEELLSEQLCSDRVLLVQRDDVVERWDPSQALHGLLQQSDPRWRDMNVLGQVSLVLKEHHCKIRRSSNISNIYYRGRDRLTSYVSIPAAYHSGVAIFMRADNCYAESLMSAPDLPLLE